MANRSASGEVKLIISPTIVNTLVDDVAATASLGDTIQSGRLTNGVSEGEFNRAWQSIDRELANGASEDIDFYDTGSIDIGAGAGLDALGQSIAFLELVCIVIKQTGGAGRLQINATSPTNPIPWIPTMTVANGGALREGAWVAFFNDDTDAFPIVDASAHTVRFGASGGAVTYSIFLMGRHDTDESSSSSISSKSSSSSASSSSTSTLSTLSSSSTGISSQSASSSSTSSNTESSSSSSSSTNTVSSSSSSSASSSSSSSLNV